MKYIPKIYIDPCICGYKRPKVVYEGGDNGVPLIFYVICKKCLRTGDECD